MKQLDTWNYPDPPQVKNGVPDLGHLEMNDRQTLELNDEWLFYPGVFLMAEDGTSSGMSAPPERTIRLPGKWDEKNVPGESGFQNGSCRLGIGIRVPPLSIQLLVENAVKHGLMQRNEGGTFTISVSRQGDQAEIAVKDDGVGMTGEQLERLLAESGHPSPQMSVGLRIIDRRLKQLFQDGYTSRARPIGEPWSGSSCRSAHEKGAQPNAFGCAPSVYRPIHPPSTVIISPLI